MSRPGITYQTVANAAAELLAQDINPTVETVRNITGTGSHGTIAMHLRTWKANQEETQQTILQETLPENLIACMKGLWQSVVNEAEEKIQTIQENYEAQNASLQSQIHILATEKLQLHEQLGHLRKQNETLTNNQNDLEHLVSTLQKENSILLSKQETLYIQLTGKKTRIEELHDLHRQAQANLEHYRESVREDRLSEQQRFTSQIQQLEQTVQQLRDNHSTLSQEKVVLIQENAKVKQTLSELEKANETLQIQASKYQRKLVASEKTLIETQLALEHEQNQTEILKQKAEAQYQLNIELQDKNKLLQHELIMVSESLESLKTNNEQLTDEKWKFVQDNAKLQGQLEQLQILLEKQREYN
ncbi:MAG: DNA-binding protein [Gammaproteobacteria bacterium]